MTVDGRPFGFNGDDIIGRIRLHRQVDHGPVVLVEGSMNGSPDRKVLKKLSVFCQVFPVGPRALVLDALNLAIGLGLEPIFALVDRDFDDVVANAVDDGLPVIAYDDADLESMLWNSSALECVLESLASERLLGDFGGPDQVRQRVDEVLLPLQKLRAANAKGNLGLDFDHLDLRRRINKSDLTLSVSGLCNAVHSQGGSVSVAKLLDLAMNFDVPTCPQSGRSLVRGKDRLAALGVALRRVLDSLSHQQSTADQIAAVLLACVQQECVEGDVWFTELTARIAA
jgi:hypothetical protein